MVEIDFSNVFKVGTKHGLSKAEFANAKKLLSKHLEGFASRDQHFHEVIDDLDTVKQIKQFAKQVKGKYTDVAVLGIGGSALGTICLRYSLQHLYEHELKHTKVPRLHVIDNVDPLLIRETEEILNIERTLFLVVSKSGGTPEPISAFLYFKGVVEKKKYKLKDHFVFVTDPQESVLRETADKEGIIIFDHPNVGGRFSVLTVVGLLPAALIGVDIDNLLKGARLMSDRFVSPLYGKNIAFQLASVQYMLAQKGKTINVMMPYAQKLVRFADWYRQLLAESIGKAENRNGKKVYAGLTPVSALGTTDQHSQTQLYNEGPHDKFIMFIRVKDAGSVVRIPSPGSTKELQYLKGASFNELLETERVATADAYTKYDRPNAVISVDRLDEFHLGQLFLLFEGATAFLGEYYNVDAFNQPGVELAKKLTKTYLVKRGK